MIYACEIWGRNQNNTLFQRITRLQEKTLRIITRKQDLKITYFIKYKNTEFARKYLRQDNLSIFNKMFHTLNQNHHYNTRAANNCLVDFSSTQTSHNGAYFSRKKTAEAWNEIKRMSILDLLKCEFKQKKEKLRLYYNKYYS